MSLFVDSYEKALERKDEYAVSGSAGVFLSSCGRSLRSEGSKRIQQQKMLPSGPIPLLLVPSFSHRWQQLQKVVAPSLLPVMRIQILAPVNGENFTATRGSSNLQAANNEDADFLIMPPTSQIEPVQQSKIPSKASWIDFQISSYIVQFNVTNNGIPNNDRLFKNLSSECCEIKKKYLRTMAREVADIKSENRDLRRLLQSRQPVSGINNNVGESRHSVFEKHVSLP
ncbi:hypothetical protein OUZ56_012193 [Daphnia magna]|uniref:Uncharacterized protein n=1 Tax=Daphnia magna TaxID=35525 RepID=A0ABQ9Z2H8_9CRUS|nr:hypothetical protein OUZ56_012193 [Daphnia magna]